MRYKINYKTIRIIVFLVIVLIINFIYYYDTSSNFKKDNYFSFESTCLLHKSSEACNLDQTKAEFRQIVEKFEDTIEKSDIKLFKNFIRFNFFAENNFAVRNKETKKLVTVIFGIEKDGKYIEAASDQGEVELLHNLTLKDLSNIQPEIFNYRLLDLLQEPNAEYQYLENDGKGIKFIIRLSWINFFVFLVISIPVAWGILLLLNAIYRFIFFGEPFAKKTMILF